MFRTGCQGGDEGGWWDLPRREWYRRVLQTAVDSSSTVDGSFYHIGVNQLFWEAISTFLRLLSWWSSQESHPPPPSMVLSSSPSSCSTGSSSSRPASFLQMTSCSPSSTEFSLGFGDRSWISWLVSFSLSLFSLV